MSLTPEQLQAAAETIQGQLGKSGEFSWENVADAARAGIERAEDIPGLQGTDKRDAVLTAMRPLVSNRLWKLLTGWRGPLAFGWWAKPLLALLVYPVIHRVLMWAFDELSPKCIDLLISASKGELKLPHGSCSCGHKCDETGPGSPA